MTTFLFASVCVSGIKVISIDGFSRRNRFILAISLGLGLGVTLVPGWALNNLWPLSDGMSSATKSFRCGTARAVRSNQRAARGKLLKPIVRRADAMAGIAHFTERDSQGTSIGVHSPL